MYNIMRIGKIKDAKQMSDTAGHNFRLREQPNIDGSKTPNNKVLLNNLDIDLTARKGLHEGFKSLYSRLGVKARSNSVLGAEIVISASPEFFEGKSPAEVEQWANSQVAFISQEFGENARVAVLHLDEKTPHLHFMLSTEQHSTKKFKNRHGESTKSSWGLNANRWNPEFLTKLHDDHAIFNEVYGLSRGKSDSKKIHKPVKEHYRDLAAKEAELNESIKKKAAMEELLRRAKGYIQAAKAIMDEQHEQIMELIEIAIGKDLTPTEDATVNRIADKAMRKNQKQRQNQERGVGR